VSEIVLCSCTGRTVHVEYGIVCAKTVESIQLSFGIVSSVSPNNHALDWRHLANTVERLCTVAMSDLPPGVATQPVSK